MTGKLTADQFAGVKKADLEKFAKEMGVSTKGTAKEIIERICSVEVEYPDDAKTQERTVRCAVSFEDLENNVVRQPGDTWITGVERAEMLEKRNLVEIEV